MPEQTTMPSNIQSQFDTASQQTEKAISMSESSAKLPSMLRDAVSERMQNSPLLPAREEAVSYMMETPTRVRDELSQNIQSGNILSPTQQQRVMAGERAAASVPVMTLNDLLQSQFGGVDTAVNAGLGAYETMLNAALARAELAQNQAQGAWDRYLQGENLRLSQQKSAQGSQPSFLEQLLAAQMTGEGQQPGISDDEIAALSQEVDQEMSGGVTQPQGLLQKTGFALQRKSLGERLSPLWELLQQPVPTIDYGINPSQTKIEDPLTTATNWIGEKLGGLFGRNE